MARAPDLVKPGWPCLVIQARQLPRTPWGVFWVPARFGSGCPASDSRVKSRVYGQHAIHAGQPENAIPSQ
jgi:hypothetical protein